MKAHHSGFYFSFFLSFTSPSGRFKEFQTFQRCSNIFHTFGMRPGEPLCICLRDAEGQKNSFAILEEWRFYIVNMQD